LEKKRQKHVVTTVIPLFMVLVGSALVAFSLGPYNNWDTQLEFEAASNVNRVGIPFVESFGTSIDQPPLGFYVEAGVMAVFGVSTGNVVAFVTLLGVGCVLVVFLLGRELYGGTVGLVAAALFGLNPWHIVLSRSGLIDVQCLLLSLLCLYMGIFAIRRNSSKITVLSGLLFAAAFLTKFYAIFILIPLLLLYFYSKPENLKRALTQLAVFVVPTVLFSFLWYQLILGRSLLSIFNHNDFIYVIPSSTNVVASPFFAANFLLNYGLGIFFVCAIGFSLFVGLLGRRQAPHRLLMHMLCLAAITIVLATNVVLGYVLDLNVPYFSAVKYLYQALPFFVLLAASLITTGVAYGERAKAVLNSKKVFLYLAAASSVALLFASLASSVYYTNAVSMHDYLQYRVEPNVDYGYALLNPAPLTVGSSLMSLQLVGFATVVCGLLWAAGQKLGWFSKLHTILDA
jgi:4-amino-4-deoxy-L-arabinose transferase-like glycosyltransferase